ncbi:hypothetical protein ACGF12_34295 [Kitasatospora sp. NPDC048296]|uniref:hypothetical protein n=1 Tax=Kitasatospora sp. NPDC048296 TaxID=3364048 RepID=UPI0037194147
MRIRFRAAHAAAAVGTAAAATLGLVAAAVPASATSDSSSWNLPGGDKWQVNAWHCGTYSSACSWSSSTKLQGGNPRTAQWIENRVELEAHGISASLTISKSPSASLTMKKRSLGEVRWRNSNSWIADNSGVMKPSWNTTFVSTRSCGSGRVNASINVSEKCAYAGAF